MNFLQGFYESRADHQVGLELGQQFFELAQRTQDPQHIMLGHVQLTYPLLFLGDPVSALAHAEQLRAMYDPLQHRSLAFLYGSDPGAVGLSIAVYALWLLGYPDQALQRSQEVFALAREVDHPFTLVGFAMAFSRRLHVWRHEVQAVQELSEAITQIATEIGSVLARAEGTMGKAWVQFEQGHHGEGIARFRQGLDAWVATGFEFHHPQFLGELAEMYSKAGQPEEGLAAVSEALALVEKSGECYWEAELYRLKGELLLMHDASAAAEASFHKAIEVARGQSAKSLELRAITSLSHLWQQQGERDRARQMLAEIYGWFTEGFDTRDLQEAKALLDELA
jgi:predicted ATPase